MIQATRVMPNTVPRSAAFPMSADGIPKINRAVAIATSMPARADTQTRWRSTTSTKKSVTTGSAAIAVDRGQEFSGS